MPTRFHYSIKAIVMQTAAVHAKSRADVQERKQGLLAMFSMIYRKFEAIIQFPLYEASCYNEARKQEKEVMPLNNEHCTLAALRFTDRMG